MHTDRWALSKDPEAVARTSRMLAGSTGIAILRELAKARRKGDGWMYLSQIATAIGETPGTVAHGLSKVAPMLEERREKGLRYFRATFVDIKLEIERPRSEPRAARPPL